MFTDNDTINNINQLSNVKTLTMKKETRQIINIHRYYTILLFLYKYPIFIT